MADALTQTFSIADSSQKAKAVASAVGAAIRSMSGDGKIAMITEAITSFNDLADGGHCGLAGMTSFGAQQG
ncbi:hypothetical protein MNEG_3373 [Monoraphidium neglectum]|jgi:hypothetical protein|uniref:Uncharacterized protein n=1 Tax=Monoraphidium neglectum TaxID=145388 RepID=A0A0D2K1Z9_9CHLO|nr:hypothetical protein MNEG_3373 [Monoraphidium neglectum]KIZ04583.1 hypothetical protein MNEG_3373 [Monoraphidium neglectum]|eukprot:XP_013903602.1 hypothetical protein MNEG_3373 [Monoraphidium neglectum]